MAADEPQWLRIARELRAMGRAAAAIVAELYDWRVVFERTFAIYDEVIGENRRRS